MLHLQFGLQNFACCVTFVFSLFQRIQTISATDPDEPLGGHRFFFSLAEEAAGKANFSVRDNKGDEAGVCAHQIHLYHLQYSVIFHLKTLQAHSKDRVQFQKKFIERLIQGYRLPHPVVTGYSVVFQTTQPGS